jgi:hypothetical protein
VDSNAATSNSAASGLGSGALVGIILGVIVLLVIIVILVLVMLRRSKQAKPQAYRSSGSAIAAVDSDGQAVVFNGGQALYDEAHLSRLPQGDFEPGVANPLYAWYQPHMSRQECEESLSSQGEGSFVVRDSSFTPGWHMIGVKTNNTVVHERIKLNADSTYEMLPSSNQHQPAFRTIPELVEYYAAGKRTGITFSLNLDNSVYDNHLLQAPRAAKPLASSNTEADAPAIPSRNQGHNTVPISSC